MQICGKTAAVIEQYTHKHTQKEMPLGNEFNNSSRGFGKRIPKESTEDEEDEASLGLSLAELEQYLRQCLHDGVQQSPHSHCHLQEFQHCRNTEELKSWW